MKLQDFETIDEFYSAFRDEIYDNQEDKLYSGRGLTEINRRYRNSLFAARVTLNYKGLTTFRTSNGRLDNPSNTVSFLTFHHDCGRSVPASLKVSGGEYLTPQYWHIPAEESPLVIPTPRLEDLNTGVDVILFGDW